MRVDGVPTGVWAALNDDTRFRTSTTRVSAQTTIIAEPTVSFASRFVSFLIQFAHTTYHRTWQVLATPDHPMFYSLHSQDFRGHEQFALCSELMGK
jgi:hypothetical protein